MAQPSANLRQLAEDLRHEFPGRLRQVLIFGSQARGEASPESDYDCLLIFDEVTPTIKARLEQLTGDYLIHQGRVLSCIPLSTAELGQHRFEPFLINAQKEGLLL